MYHQRSVTEVRKARKSWTEGHAFLRLFVAKRLINGAAAALTGVFFPIFLYEVTDHNFAVVASFYAITYLLFVIFLVPSMRILNRVGFSRSLVVAGVFNIIFIGFMNILSPDNFWIYVLPLGLAIVLFRLFHWVPYHVDFTLFTKSSERGQMVGLSRATILFMGVIGPILAGFIISEASYQVLFSIVLVFSILGTISYMFVPETNTQFQWSFSETWKKVFAKENRGVSGAEFASGVEGAVGLIVWPVFLFEILNGDVFEIGAVTTVVVGVTIVLQLLLGKYIDLHKDTKERTLKIGSTFYAIGWIFKIFVLSAAHVFFVGLYHNLASIFTRTPFNAILYDICGDKGEYIDEYTVIREIAIQGGRFVALVFIVLLTTVMSLQWTFVLAALAAIGFNMVSQNMTNKST